MWFQQGMGRTTRWRLGWAGSPLLVGREVTGRGAESQRRAARTSAGYLPSDRRWPTPRGTAQTSPGAKLPTKSCDLVSVLMTGEIEGHRISQEVVLDCGDLLAGGRRTLESRLAEACLGSLSIRSSSGVSSGIPISCGPRSKRSCAGRPLQRTYCVPSRGPQRSAGDALTPVIWSRRGYLRRTVMTRLSPIPLRRERRPKRHLSLGLGVHCP